MTNRGPTGPLNDPGAGDVPPPWHVLLRALREARAVTQEGWAALLGVGVRTVQRWERGTAAPDAHAEEALLSLCAERGLFRRYDRGPLAGFTLTAAVLSTLLAEARLETGRTERAATPGPPPATIPATAGEARDLPSGTLTLLFTDIEQSTRRLLALGDSYDAVLADHYRILRAVWGAHGGVEVDTAGDGFFVVFGRARAAVTAAIAAQQALAAHPWPKDGAIHVRIGIHTGEPRRLGNSYVGLDVHRAARIQAAGHGGQVLISAATALLLEGDGGVRLGLRDLGRHHLKDLPRPERLFQVDIPGLPADFPPIRSLERAPATATLLPSAGRPAPTAAAGRLIEQRDGQVGRVYPLGAGTTVIGRDQEAAIHITDGRVSLRHAQISWDGRRYVLSDLGSTNGTFLNGARLTAPRPLAAGDVIRLAGRPELSFVVNLTDRTVPVHHDEPET